MRIRARLVSLIAALVLCAALFGSAGANAAASTWVALIINENGNSIVAMDPATHEIIGMLDTGGVLSRPHLGAYDAANHRLYVGNKGSNFAVYDVQLNPLALKLVANVKPGGDGEIHWVVVSNGLVWLAHQGDSTLYAYDPADFSAPKLKFGKEQGFDTTHGAAMRPGTDELWVTNRPAKAPGTVIRVNTKTRALIGQPLRTTGKDGDQPNNVGFTADGRWAYAVNTGAAATQVTVIDATTFTVTQQIEQDGKQGLSPHALVFDPQSKRIFIANQNGNNLSVIDTTTNTVVKYLQMAEEPHGVTLGPDGLIYTTARKGNEVAIFNPQTLEVVTRIMTPAIQGPHQTIFVDTAMPGLPNTGAGGGQAGTGLALALLAALGSTLGLAALLTRKQLRRSSRDTTA